MLRQIDYNGHVPTIPMSETGLYARIEAMCDDLDLLWTRNPDSRAVQGTRGFPDYVIAGPYGTLFREAKTDSGELSTGQRRWRYMLTGGGADWSTWTPADLESGRIKRELDQVSGEPQEL